MVCGVWDPASLLRNRKSSRRPPVTGWPVASGRVESVVRTPRVTPTTYDESTTVPSRLSGAASDVPPFRLYVGETGNVGPESLGTRPVVPGSLSESHPFTIPVHIEIFRRHGRTHPSSPPDRYTRNSPTYVIGVVSVIPVRFCRRPRPSSATPVLDSSSRPSAPLLCPRRGVSRPVPNPPL